MVARITELRPEITKIMATLVLPRAPDRRRACLNRPFVVRFNREAGCFNHLLRAHCRRSRTLFFIDHALEWLPPGRVLAADGVHPSFEGIALIAGHLRSLLLRNTVRSPSTGLTMHPWGCQVHRASISRPEVISRTSTKRTVAGTDHHRNERRGGAPHGPRNNRPYDTTLGHAEAAGGSASPSRD
ncbi:hypothetical protein MTO96_038644 [Rhipicephalus appendiculatus]